MKVGSQPGLKVSTWVNRAARIGHAGSGGSRAAAWRTLRSRGMAASLDQRGADTPARMCPSHRELVQICGLPLRRRARTQDPRPTRCSSRRCRRCNSRLGARISGRRSPRMSVDPATSRAGVPCADIHAAASCISRTTSSISPSRRPERSEAPRCPFAPLGAGASAPSPRRTDRARCAWSPAPRAGDLLQPFHRRMR